MGQKHPRLFAVGDIHGHYLELLNLYEILLEKDFDPERDTIVFLGDMVDGGPQVKDVIQQLIDWQKEYPHWVFLKGNHEDMMLDALVGRNKKYGDFYLWWNQGGRATVRSYTEAMSLSDYERALMKPIDAIPGEHLEWLLKRPIYYQNEDFFFVHAGVPHAIKLENMAHKIDEGDADYIQQALWIRDEFINSTHHWEKKIIFGHTPQNKPLVMENKIGIDTMTRFGGRLTAVELSEERFYQTPSTQRDSWT